MILTFKDMVLLLVKKGACNTDIGPLSNYGVSPGLRKDYHELFAQMLTSVVIARACVLHLTEFLKPLTNCMGFSDGL